MRVEKIPVGTRLIDSVQFSMGATLHSAASLRHADMPIDGVVAYLASLNEARRDAILEAGLGLLGVTYAGTFDGQATLNQMKALALPVGASVFLDLEGPKAFDTPIPILMGNIARWNAPLVQAGYKTGIYVGSPQPLNSQQLYSLPVTMYWNALSRESDKQGNLAEPICGWCIWQMNPSVIWGNTGILVDVNIVGQDFKGRVPTWVKA